jgi:hypothetical protein
MQIKKGDRFFCHTSVEMLDEPENITYYRGYIYHCDIDGCITNANGDKQHAWDNSGADRVELYFSKLEENQNIPLFYPRQEGDEVEVEGIRKFDSGAVRDSNEGKSRPDLISPYFTDRLGHRLALGAKKYQERNWEKGIPDAAFLESLERHLVSYKMGKQDEDHAAAIAFNIMGIIHNEEIRKL